MADVCISKPEVVISQPPIEILTKFGLLIDCDLLKAVTSTNTKPEVVFSSRGRHLEKWIWRHISAVGDLIWTKFGSLMQNKMQITGKWPRSEPEVKFQYGRRLFFQTRSRYISAINLYYVDHWGRRNLVCWQILTFWRQGHQQIRNRK